MPVEADHFSMQVQGLQIAWDATSYKAFMACPRYYQYSILMGFRSRRESMHLTFGRYYHEALELYDKLKATGDETHDQIVEQVYNAVVTISKDWDTEDSLKNRFNLIRSVMWYMMKWEVDPIPTAMVGPGGTPAVELSFQFPLEGCSKLTGEQLSLCGHMDGICALDTGQLFVRERKTTKNTLSGSFFNEFRTDIQVDLYNLAGLVITMQSIAGVLIDGVQVAVNFSRYGRQYIPKNKDQRKELLKDIDTIQDAAERYAEKEYWPRHTRHCYQCDFKAVCAESPAIRQSVLEADFKVERWNPLEARD
jgi:CRISPR/Cas system-associated exonuclease Cas4 (RecB family)